MFCDVVAEYSRNGEEFGLKDVQFCVSKKNEDGCRVGSLFAAFCAYLKNYNELGPLDPVYRHFVELEPEEPGDAEIDNYVMHFSDVSTDSEPDAGAVLDPLDPEFMPD